MKTFVINHSRDKKKKLCPIVSWYSNLKGMLLIVLQPVVQQHTQRHDAAVKLAVLGCPVWVNNDGGLIREHITPLPTLPLKFFLALTLLILRDTIFNIYNLNFSICKEWWAYYDQEINKKCWCVEVQGSVITYLSIIIRSAWLFFLHTRRLHLHWLFGFLHLLLHL